MQPQLTKNLLHENFTKMLFTSPGSFILPPITYSSLSFSDQAKTDTSDSTSETHNDSEGISSNSKSIKKVSNNRKDKYSVIPNKVRLELIDAIINKKEKINRAAIRLGINYSSAKSIIQVYQREGRSNKKISKKTRAKQPQSISDDLAYEPNLQNPASDHSSKLIMLSEPLSIPSSEHSKPRKPTSNPSDSLLAKLSIKLQSSETHSDCSTDNSLTFSRISSGSSVNHSSKITKKDLDKLEMPTFFTKLNSELHDLHEVTRPALLSPPSNDCTVVKEEDVSGSRYQFIPTRQEAPFSTLTRFQEDQSELTKEIIKNKILTQQLNKLNQLNLLNTLLLQTQTHTIPALTTFPERHMDHCVLSSLNQERNSKPTIASVAQFGSQQDKLEQPSLRIPPFNPGFQSRNVRLV